VVSPTFSLIEIYRLPDITVVHADLYRLEHRDELLGCGLLDYLAETDLLLVIEWPEIARHVLPDDTVSVELVLRADGTRMATTS
jgi:tRNA threonylcarbamoyl adenosine modification protein YjeE